MRRNWHWLLGLLVIASMALSACGGAEPEPTPAETTGAAEETAEQPAAKPAVTGPKILKARINADIQNMDPANYKSQSDTLIASAILDGLVGYAPNSYELENQLAESIEMSDDGLVITFKLKEGVMWQKGYGELTTEDVKFSYERYIDQENPAVYADDWAALDHVEIIDQYNGQIILKEPLATLWTTTMPVTAGKIVCKKQVEEVGVDKFSTDLLVGTGPYLLQEWRPKEKIILARNPDYHGETPVWEEIHLYPIEDIMAAEVALEAGELNFSEIPVASTKRFESNPAFKVLQQQTLQYTWIGMNVENPKLADINVRRAIRYALDVPSMLAATYMGAAQQGATLIAPGLLGYWEDAPVYARDLEKAKAYMAAAGLEQLDLKIQIQDQTHYRTWAQIARENLAEIGINLEIIPMDSSTFWSIGDGDAGLDVELFVMRYSMNPDPAWATMWFVCEQVGIWNWMRWCSPEYDTLHNEGQVTLDTDRRQEIYEGMEMLWDAAAHTVWICHEPVVYAYSPDIIPATTPHGNVQLEGFRPSN